MRLIDADDFLEINRNAIILAKLCTTNSIKKEILQATYELIEERVNEASTADAMLIKHGEWIREGRGYCRCSVCNREFEEDFLYYEKKKPAYCPDCGAKMDGGDNNATG